MANQLGSLADQGIPHRSRVAKRASKSSSKQWPIWLVLLLGLGALMAWQWQMQQQINANDASLRQALNQQTQLAERLDQLGLSEQSFASMLDLEELIQQQHFFAQQLEVLQSQPTDTWRSPIAELEQAQAELAEQILTLQQSQASAFDDQPLRQTLTEQDQRLDALSEELQVWQSSQEVPEMLARLDGFEQQLQQLDSRQQALHQEFSQTMDSDVSQASNDELLQLRNQLSALSSQLDDLSFRQELQRSELAEIRTAAGTDITLEQWIKAMDANRMEMTQRLNALMSR